MKNLEKGDYVYFCGPASEMVYITSWGVVANIGIDKHSFVTINFFDHRLHRLKQTSHNHRGLLQKYITKNTGKYNFEKFQSDYPEYII